MDYEKLAIKVDTLYIYIYIYIYIYMFVWEMLVGCLDIFGQCQCVIPWDF